MTACDGLTWQEAMRRGHGALRESESLYEDINASEGRSNLDWLPAPSRPARSSPTRTRERPQEVMT